MQVENMYTIMKMIDLKNTVKILIGISKYYKDPCGLADLLHGCPCRERRCEDCYANTRAIRVSKVSINCK